MLFLSDAQLERARTDRSYPRDRVFAQLQMACDRHLSASPERLRSLSPVRNLLVWNAFIGELGLMYAITDDDRYLRHLLVFVRGLARDGWRSVETTEHLHAPSVLTALAGMHDLLGSRLGAEDAEGLQRTMVAVAEFLWDDLHSGAWGSRERTVWNHNVIAYSAMGVAALALDGHRHATEWRDVATERTRHFLEVGVSAAGMTREGHHYCGYVFKHLGLFLQGLSSREQEHTVVATPDLTAKLHRVPVWYAHDLFPRGRWLQNYNDSHWDPHSSLLGFLLSFTRYEPDICAAVWNRLVGKPGRKTFGFDSRFSSLAEAMTFFPSGPIRPLQDLELGDTFVCPDVGYLSARNGWNREASVFTFNSGPLVGRIHDHADNNSFTFIADGSPLVIDSGSANDPREGSPSSSLGHNLVFVDGAGEGTAGAGAGVSGAILGFHRADDYVAVVGDATESYRANPHNPVRHAMRHALFVKAPIPYLVTWDDFDKDGHEHRYEYVVHVPSGNDGAASTASLEIGTNTGEPAGRLWLLHPRDVRVTIEPFETQRRPRGPFNWHALCRFETDAVAPGFVALYASTAVTEEGEPQTEVRWSSTTVIVRVQWRFGTDEITFSKQGTREAVQLPTLTRSTREGTHPALEG